MLMFISLFMAFKLQMSYGKYPQCVEEYGVPIAAALQNPLSPIAIIDCIRGCFEQQMKDKSKFFNGMVFYEESMCYCTVNMTDISAISPNGTKTCFFGPIMEDLSLTLHSIPDTTTITPGDTFEFSHSMSYANLYYPTKPFYMELEASQHNERHAFGFQSISMPSLYRTNLATDKFEFQEKIDGNGTVYKLCDDESRVKMLDKNMIDGNQIHYTSSIKMGDARSSPGTTYLTMIIDHHLDYGIYIRHSYIEQAPGDIHSIGKMVGLPTIVETYDSTRQDDGVFSVIHTDLRNSGNTSITDMMMAVHFPPFIQPKLYVQWCHHVLKLDNEKNTVHIYFRYLDPAARSCRIVFKWKVLEHAALKTSVNNIVFNVHLERTYCPYDRCDEITKMTSEAKIWQFQLLGKNEMDDYDSFRFKNIETGTCWDLNNDVVTTNTKCKTNFKYTLDSKITAIQNDGWLKFVGHVPFVSNKLMIDSTYGNHFYYTKSKNVIQLYRSTSLRCLSENNENIIHGPYKWTTEIGNCTMIPGTTSTKVKLLKGWKDYSNIDLKSILKVTTPLGETIFICNPGGDKGNVYNCFYSNSKGRSWTAMDSLITNIRLYSTITESIYGTINRGKSYFQMKLAGGKIGRINPISITDYTTVKSQVTSTSIYLLDDVTLTVDMTSLAPDIQVTSHGVYLMVNNEARKVFAWGY